MYKRSRTLYRRWKIYASISQGLSNDALVKRLQELQEKFVGCEKKNDQKLKEKRKARKNFALSQREKRAKTARKMEDDGIMVKVYHNFAR